MNDAPNDRMVTQVIIRVSKKIASVMEDKGWKNPVHGRLVADYVQSLVKGDGSPPQGLYLESARLVHTAFTESICELAVDPGTFPGQRVDAPGVLFAAAS